MKRYEINNKIKANLKRMEALQAQNVELYRQTIMLSDRTQQYKEQQEDIGTKKQPKMALVGRIHWKELFGDESTGKTVAIDRSSVVRIDGKWVNGH